MQDTVSGTDVITVKKDELYQLVKLAVYDALSNMDFITPPEKMERDQAFKELQNGEAISWDDYMEERGLHS